MRSFIIIVFFLLLVNLVHGQYQVGDVVDNMSWTDNTGEYHSIYELNASGKVVVLFWGSYG